MRNAFAAELMRLGETDTRIVLLSGDIGNRLFDGFKAKSPDRFFNCGVAEANMAGMAAGMAASGLRPITYTITPFNTTRCLEQIKIDICYQNLPVIIVGVGSGLSYAGLGATHHSFEDIALMRVLPGMTILCPGDAVEVRLALAAALECNGPVYLRLGKKNEPVVHSTPPAFRIGKGIEVRDGSDVCILSTGNILPVALSAADLLSGHGISSRVVSMHTVKPLDTVLLSEVFAGFRLVVTVEEHSRIGGFGGCVSEWLADQPAQQAGFCRMGLPDRFLSGTGNQDNARTETGLSPGKITETVLKGLEDSHPA